MMSVLTEYDEEKHLRLTRIQSKEEGNHGDGPGGSPSPLVLFR